MTGSARVRAGSRTAAFPGVGIWHRGQLAGPVEVDQSPGVSGVGFALGPRCDRNERGGDHFEVGTQTPQQPGQVIARRSRLITKAQRPGIAERTDEAPHARLVRTTDRRRDVPFGG